MKDILISVIIPVYNVEKYLVRCLESVLNQTYANLEIIIVDDGSTDNSNLICNRYAEQDARIRVYKKENGGLADARNYGLERATGDYIGYVDSDDYIELDFYQKLTELAMVHQADVVACRYKIEKDGKIENLDESKQVHVMTGEEMLSWYITKKSDFEGKFTPSVWDRIYRTECIREIRFLKGRNYEDIVYTTLVLINAKRCVYYDYAGYIYEIRQGSIMNEGNILRELEDEIFQFKNRLTVLKENKKTELVDKCLYDLFYLMLDKRCKYCHVKEAQVKDILKEYKLEMKKMKREVLRYSLSQNMSCSKLIGINLACCCLLLYKKLSC